MIPHPFQWLSKANQKRALWFLLPLTWIVMYALTRIGEPLRNSAAPNGIISFELAGTMARANEIGFSWAPANFFHAGLSLGLDYLYMPLYAGSIALCCVLLSQGSGRGLNLCGSLLAWGQLGAGGLDAAENYALIQVLLGEQAEFWPMLARLCAIPKFVIVALGLLFVLVAGLVRLWQALRANPALVKS
jgi:hypothetical protein